MKGVMRRDGLIAAGTAWAGLVLGHLLAYALAYPAEAVRRSHLAGTGHGWLDVVTLSLLAVVPAVLALTAIRSLTAGSRGTTWVRLAGFQVPAFLLIEVAERGASFDRAFADPAVLLGLAVQILVAAMAALLLRGFSRAVAAVAARVQPSWAPTATAPARAAPDLVPPHLLRLVRARRRAPPLPIAP
jgi:hypothetical protein